MKSHPHLADRTRNALLLAVGIAVLAVAPFRALADGQFVLVQDVMSPVNLRDVATAMEPRRPFGAPLWVRPTVDGVPYDRLATRRASSCGGSLPTRTSFISQNPTRWGWQSRGLASSTRTFWSSSSPRPWECSE